MEPTSTRDAHAGRPIAESVTALLANIIDYAGLFPPASLDMATTVANYASHLGSEDAWLLERLIVPAARLDVILEAGRVDHDLVGVAVEKLFQPLRRPDQKLVL
jgi:hypothetical protein